ncbi:ras guanine nucleotide exchange factor domain-containing protein [Kalaharituber pfeilii]|nr:ras guanine nucleotide exchange factor domain-containing protein [Kalaharituber pfeilii]
MATATAAHHHDLFTRNAAASGNEVGQNRYLNGSSGGYGNAESSARERSRSRGGAANRSTQTGSASQYSHHHSQSMSNGVSNSVYQNDMDQPRMYVRALYSFRSDDPTSLSFNQGDLIQVLTQLESGWWDGIVHGQRGWFPSNYCVVVNSSDYRENGVGISPLDDSDDTEDGSSGDEGEDEDSDRDGIGSPQLPMEGTDDRDADEALFWIPQATPDGRLFYFNTRTGESRMELPLETPTSTTETGPRDRSNFSVPEQTRPPPEMMAGGYEREEPEYEDADSTTSEREGEALFISPGNVDDPRQSFISEGSSSQSVRSRHSGTFVPDNHSERTLVESGSVSLSSHNTIVNNSLSADIPMTQPENTFSNPSEPQATVKIAGSKPSTATFYNDNIPTPTTWDALIEETRLSIERYRDAINKRERAKYVRRAEDISDMLRLLIAAGSATTDNHSGQPSIISTNKPLHPHFRQFMAAFSKLVLSSHIASADFPPPDTESKCLSEAEEVLSGVFRFAEVARAQRKDVLPRLKPGFVVGSSIEDGWNNHPHTEPIATTSQLDHNASNGAADGLVTVDNNLNNKLEELNSVVRPALRRLEASLESSDSLATPYSQSVLCSYVTSAAIGVVDALKQYFHMIDRIDLQPFTLPTRSPSYEDVVSQKQRLYDSFADLVMACQALTSPLADEWTYVRGESLDDRLTTIRVYIKEVETGIQTLAFSVSLLVGERDLRQPQAEVKKEDWRKTSSDVVDNQNRPLGAHARTQSRQNHPRITSMVGERPGANYEKGGGESKLKRHWGIQPQVTAEPAETPWFLGCDYDHEILYGKKKEVKGGTLVALVERLTRHDILDSSFISTFLLTYQSFTTADELFNQLARRFTIQPPLNLTPAEYELWVEKKQKLIRVRVLSVLKQWMESYWMENDDDAGKDLLRRIHTFAKDVMLPHLAGTSKLMEVIESRIKGIAPDKKMVQNFGQAPPPILPKNMKKLKFLDIDTMEFARQLTIIESRAYRKLKPTDCLNKAWSKDKTSMDGSEPASNVRSIILHSNQLTNWVAEMILTQTDVKRRVVVIKHFIAVAEKCRQLNNFSTLTSIISALGAAPIHRLKRTWDHVPTRTTAILENMKVLMGTTLNFNEYRECLHLVNPPCVPFLGVYLKDLTFVADGNPDFIKGTELINFGKRAKTAAIIREIQQYQSVPYPLQSIQELQDYILQNMQAAKDVTEMFNVSLALEPREREDEKIARLLQESGFL